MVRRAVKVRPALCSLHLVTDSHPIPCSGDELETALATPLARSLVMQSPALPPLPQPLTVQPCSCITA